MRCKHDEGFDWSHASLDRQNGGWKVRCLACGEVVTHRRLRSALVIERHTLIYGPKQHMSKKERLKRRKEESNGIRQE